MVSFRAAGSLFLVSSLAVVAQEGQFVPQTCTPFDCPADTEPVPKLPLELISMGCSAMGGGSEIVSSGPNTPVLGLCCALQQACLQICGNTKTYCDEQFSNCNNEVCGSLEEEEEKSKCQKASILYKAMVKVGQCEKYDEGQQAGCRCVTKDEAPKAREEILRAFLEVHNPEKVDQASTLAARANTSAKFADLILKMVTIYPDAIKIGNGQQKEEVGTRQEENGSPDKNEDLGTVEL